MVKVMSRSESLKKYYQSAEGKIVKNQKKQIMKKLWKEGTLQKPSDEQILKI